MLPLFALLNFPDDAFFALASYLIFKHPVCSCIACADFLVKLRCEAVEEVANCEVVSWDAVYCSHCEVANSEVYLVRFTW